ncbi:hypothetical protein [Streptomyces melanogenes]|uniref:hypothetical protein n=1 Tax=Streptomyces melanogenes TaxID=67326 RepID=UPI003797B8DA
MVTDEEIRKLEGGFHYTKDNGEHGLLSDNARGMSGVSTHDIGGRGPGRNATALRAEVYSSPGGNGHIVVTLHPNQEFDENVAFQSVKFFN